MLGDPAFVRAADRIWELIRAAQARPPSSRAAMTPRAPWRTGRASCGASTGRCGGRAVGAVVDLGGAELAPGWVPALFLPSPLGVLAEGVDMLALGRAGGHLAASLKRLVLGFVVGGAAGIAVGSRWASSPWRRPWARRSSRPRFPIPKIALLPLLILWLGIGEASKVAVIALGVFFPPGHQHLRGVRQADPLLVRAAVAFGAGRWSVIAR